MNLTLDGQSGLSGLFSSFPPFFVACMLALWVIAQLIIVIVLAVAVLDDARRLQHSAGGLFLVSPWVWFFIVLFTGGYFGALGYWLIHYSAQRYRA